MDTYSIEVLHEDGNVIVVLVDEKKVLSFEPDQARTLGAALLVHADAVEREESGEEAGRFVD
jgi:hypothetical protein